MKFAYRLADILEKSIEKHGDQPLTVSHLLNIVKLCIRLENASRYKMDKALDEAMMEMYADQCGDRD